VSLRDSRTGYGIGGESVTCQRKSALTVSQASVRAD